MRVLLLVYVPLMVGQIGAHLCFSVASGVEEIITSALVLLKVIFGAL